MLLQSIVALLLLFAGLALSLEDFYKVLELPNRSATDKEIKAAYRRLSKRFHPDKNPDDKKAAEKFLHVAEAYEVLIDPEMRKAYNAHGHNYKSFVKDSPSSGRHDPFDLFSRFFGGTGHFGRQAGQRRGPNIEVKIGISLRDFYNGRTTEFQWDKQHVCDECEGTGAADKHVETCNTCGGRGVRIQRHQIAPGMFQQMQTSCEACGGRGSVIKKKCPACAGARVIRKSTPVQLEIVRGAARNSRIVYENEADEDPDYVAGDLFVTLTEKDPSFDEDNNPDRVDGAFFRRKDDDLYWREVLSLREAWMGDWSRNLTHLDGHVVRLGRARGEVVQPGHVDTIPDEGMPKYHELNGDVYHTIEFGRLYVEYIVVLPDQMDSGMEQDFWSLWQTWREKIGVDLRQELKRPDPDLHPHQGGHDHEHEHQEL